MSSSVVLGAVLLTVVALSTVSSAQDCCFRDACSGVSICVERNGTFTDSCGETFRAKQDCKLSRECCFTDACSKEQLCKFVDEQFSDTCEKKYVVTYENGQCGLDRVCCYEDNCSKEQICARKSGLLKDSCGSVFDVAPDCSLSKSDGKKDMKEVENGKGEDIDQDADLTPTPEQAQTSTPGATQPTKTPIAEPTTQPPTTTTPTTTTPTTTTPTTTTTTPGDTDDDQIATTISSEAVCIHSQHLSHLPASALFYPRHVLANILCDISGSCATPGHMVVYRGESMRMSGYCRIVGCQRQRGLVNSPRYSRGGRIESSTAGLEFTMLAARFETRLEEILLGGLVRAGL